MKFRLLGTASILSLAITGCGGGGGSANSAAATIPEPSNPGPVVVTTTPEPTDSTAPVTATEQLRASDDFELSSSLEIAVQIDISGLDNSSGYLSICSAVEDSAPDYDNCFVRTALSESNFEGTLQLSTALDVAYSAIWFLDMSRAPVITKHNLGNRAIEVNM